MSHYLLVFFLFCSASVWGQYRDYPFQSFPNADVQQFKSLDPSPSYHKLAESEAVSKTDWVLWLRHSPTSVQTLFEDKAEVYLEIWTCLRRENKQDFLGLKLRIEDQIGQFPLGLLRDKGYLQIRPLRGGKPDLKLRLETYGSRDLSKVFGRPVFELEAYYLLSKSDWKRLQEGEAFQSLSLDWQQGRPTWVLTRLWLLSELLAAWPQDKN